MNLCISLDTKPKKYMICLVTKSKGFKALAMRQNETFLKGMIKYVSKR